MITPMHSNNHLLLEISVVSSFSKSYENSCSQIFASLEECLNQSIVLAKNFNMWVPKFIFTITTVERAIFFHYLKSWEVLLSILFSKVLKSALLSSQPSTGFHILGPLLCVRHLCQWLRIQLKLFSEPWFSSVHSL